MDIVVPMTTEGSPEGPHASIHTKALQGPEYDEDPREQATTRVCTKSSTGVQAPAEQKYCHARHEA
eukprot:3220267-Pleurochrysis_carterae.AAC.3